LLEEKKMETKRKFISKYYTNELELKKIIEHIRGPKSLDQELFAQIYKIIKQVESKGDRALFRYTEKFDGVKVYKKDLRVSQSEISDAYSKVTKEQLSAIKFMKRQVERFERRLFRKNGSFTIKTDGLLISSELEPLESIGCYVPGGKAGYPSSLVMSAVPARIAGVERVVVCTPPSRTREVNPLLLVAGDICNVTEFYRVGGAQAIAALAFGTETIQSVQKIVGPGNVYVNTAKLIVSHTIAIDLPAGPTEILIIADSHADCNIVIRDLISQAEHSSDCVCGVITPSSSLAEKIVKILPSKIGSIKGREIVGKSLASHGFIIVCKDLNEATEFCNLFAPEHLEIITVNPTALANKIHSAGLILLGPYSPVAASDYCIGTNHILPTAGFARSYSSLSSTDFLKRKNTVQCSKRYLLKIRDTVNVLALSEGFLNHSLAIEERFQS
jgi:histidinol dehydrogenase